MKKYIVLYHASGSAMKKMQEIGPEEMKKGMEPWMIWAKKCGRNLVNLGAPLGGGIKLSKTGSEPSKKNVVGYSILQAENIETAKKLLKNHPHLEWTDGCEIEVHEAQPLPNQ